MTISYRRNNEVLFSSEQDTLSEALLDLTDKIKFSPTERLVLGLILEGASYADIASELSLTLNNIKVVKKRLAVKIRKHCGISI